MNPADLRAAFTEIGIRQAAAFDSNVASLGQLLRRADPLGILATLAHYGLQAGLSENSVEFHGRLGEDFSQHHVEALQAILLTVPREEWGSNPASPDAIQTAIDKIKDAAQSFHQRRMGRIADDEPSDRRIGIQEQIRLHTQIIRNWSYYGHMLATSRELYSPLDSVFVAKLGFKISDAITIFDTAIRRVEHGSNQRLSILRRVFRERKPQRLIRRYFQLWPGVEGDPEGIIDSGFRTASREQAAMLILSHADLELPNLYKFNTAEISKSAKIPWDTVERILRFFSLGVSELAGKNVEHIFLDNPVWRSPVINLGDGFYYCVCPQGFLSHIHGTINGALERVGSSQTLAKRRSEFLERKVIEVMTSALGVKPIAANFRWKVDGVQYETDSIFQIDRTIIIIEAKSGTLSPSALRGAIDRTRRHVEELVFHPSEQSLRLEKLLWEAHSGDPTAISALQGLPTDITQIGKTVRLSVTLEDFAALSALENQFKEIKWLDAEHPLSPALSINDLYCVVDILSRPVFVVHYLSERMRVQKTISVVGDELDILGLYLTTGFNFSEVEKAKPILLTVGMSRSIDQYYMGIDEGISLEKPRALHTELWLNVLSGLQERAFPGWLEVAMDLLRVADYREQTTVESNFKRIAKGVAKSWRLSGHQNAAMILPPPDRDAGVIFFTYPQSLNSSRKSSAENLALQFFEASRASRCIVIGKRLDMLSAPYNFISVLQRPT